LLRRFLAERMDEDEAARAVAELPAALLRHSFPGNVRELRNVAERYAALREIGGDWESALGRDAETDSAASALPAAARNTRLRDDDILAALEACGHHRARAAEKLGVTRRALQYRLAALRSRSQLPEPPERLLGLY